MTSPGDDDMVPPAPERVADLVGSLASVMRQTGITELDLGLGTVSIRLRRPAMGEDPALDTRAPAAPIRDVAAETPGHLVTAPMVGTFYVAPTPSAAPFVSVGDHVVAGQTIGIIEAMKIMNEITADRSGVVLEIVAANARPVEYGSPLIRLGVNGGDVP